MTSWARMGRGAGHLKCSRGHGALACQMLTSMKHMLVDIGTSRGGRSAYQRDGCRPEMLRLAATRHILAGASATTRNAESSYHCSTTFCASWHGRWCYITWPAGQLQKASRSFTRAVIVTDVADVPSSR
jgi:hypothetical protein